MSRSMLASVNGLPVGPMTCAPEIVFESGYFYRLRLTGKLDKQASGFLKPAVATRVQKVLPASEGALVQEGRVRPFLFVDPQPAELRLPPPFVLVGTG